MNREEMITIVKELLNVVNSKKVTPNEAKTIAGIFERSVCENNEKAVEKYMETAIFAGSPPES